MDQWRRLVIDEKEDKERMLQEQNKILWEQIDYLTKKLFGTSSEKKATDPGQINLFDEAEKEQVFWSFWGSLISTTILPGLFM